MCFGYLVLYPKYALMKIDFFGPKSCVISVGIWGMKNFIEYLTARLSNFTFGHPVNIFFASIELKINQNWSFFFVNGLLGNIASWTKGFLAITIFLIFLDTLYLMFISKKCHFCKTGGHFFISAPIFKFKVSIDLSHQCGLYGVVLLKIDGAVPEILMKTCFVRNVFH